jgi:two-component system cell cycle sensor histidine kinase/response regulator CckA
MSMSNRTILIVDDEAAQRDLMRRVLHTQGYTVLECPDYEDALAAQQKHLGEIDLLVIDLSLPGGNGYDLSIALLAVEPHLKVLLISGHAGAELRKFFDTPLEELHFLEKPFRPADLLQRVKYVMESSDPFAGTASAQ